MLIFFNLPFFILLSYHAIVKSFYHEIKHCHIYLNTTTTIQHYIATLTPHHTAMQLTLHGGVLGLYSPNTFTTLNLLTSATPLILHRTYPCNANWIAVHLGFIHRARFTPHRTVMQCQLHGGALNIYLLSKSSSFVSKALSFISKALSIAK